MPLFDRAGRPLGHMAVMSTSPVGDDVPALSILKIFAARAAAEIERKLAEEALAQEKDLAQVTLASIGDGVVRTDAAGIVDYLNPVAERLTGWSMDEACGQPVAAIFSVVDEVTGKPIPSAVDRCLAAPGITSADQDVRAAWKVPVSLPLTVSGGINNVWGKDPPVCVSCSLNGYDASNYDLPGRFWYVEANLKF